LLVALDPLVEAPLLAPRGPEPLTKSLVGRTRRVAASFAVAA
jgi:hypothetical protein